jgi:hypothetical protein
MLNENTNVELGLSNGSYGIIASHNGNDGVQFPVGTVFTEVEFDGAKFLESSNVPLLVLMQFSTPITKIKLPGFPEDLLDLKIRPIGRTTAQYSKAQGLRFGIIQVPISPASSVTIFKAQGLTLPLVIAPAFAGHERVPRTALYVLLSRVRSSDCVVLLEHLGKAELGHFRPSANCFLDQIRLQEIMRKSFPLEQVTEMIEEAIKCAFDFKNEMLNRVKELQNRQNTF